MIRGGDFSSEERAALALWPAVEPPPGFADRVVSQTGVLQPPDRRRFGLGLPPPWTRGLAFAAIAVVLLGGLWLVRGTRGPGGASPASGAPDHASGPAVLDPDGGARPETAETAARVDHAAATGTRHDGGAPMMPS